MCVFEVLHFLPLALIIFTAINFRAKTNILFATALTALSIVGIFAGNHAHTEHSEFFGLLDPCNAYIITIILNAYIAIKSLKQGIA